jgi:molybdenum cofactor cytidylyltransferase
MLEMEKPDLQSRNYTAIVLGAGESARYGSMKLQAKLENKTLLEIMLDKLIGLFSSIILVEGCYPLGNLIGTRPVTLVHNEDWKAGQLGSLKKAIQSGKSNISGGIFVFLADLPLIQEQTIRYMLDSVPGAEAAYPLHDGRRGHPVFLGAKALKVLESARADQKAMEIIKEFQPREIVVDDPGIYLDVDTQEDLKRIEQNFKSS